MFLIDFTEFLLQIMSKGKKKKSKKKDAAFIEQNTQSLRRFLKLYDQYSTEQDSVACTEVTKSIRALIEEGESFSKVKIYYK
jgi:hypothetical protein